MTDQAVGAYLATLPADQRELLQRVRATVVRLVPDAVELISYGMPAFKLDGRFLVSYAGWKTHCSIYPLTDSFLAAQRPRVAGLRAHQGQPPFHAR